MSCESNVKGILAIFLLEEGGCREYQNNQMLVTMHPP